MIRKRIPRISDTVTEKMTVSTSNNVAFIEFHAIASSITCNKTFEKLINISTNQILVTSLVTFY